MTRQEKYPDTNTFHYYNANPKNRITTDCTIRAMSEATGIDYYSMVMKLAEYHCRHGVDPRDGGVGMNGFLEELGYVKYRQPRKEDGTKYTGSEFCIKFRNLFDNIIANIGGNHVTCIKKHLSKLKIWDIWNCSHKCVGNFWVRVK